MHRHIKVYRKATEFSVGIVKFNHGRMLRSFHFTFT